MKIPLSVLHLPFDCLSGKRGKGANRQRGWGNSISIVLLEEGEVDRRLGNQFQSGAVGGSAAGSQRDLNLNLLSPLINVASN